MAWIESHQSLGQHPKTRKLARLLNIPIPQAIGHLQLLWWWALDYAQEGELGRYEDADIADAVLWDGSPSLLMASLLDARFLDQPVGKPCIHDWDQYGGKLIARRKADAARKPKPGNPADIHENSDGVPADVQWEPRVEKSREEKSTQEESTEREPAAPRARKRVTALTDDERHRLLSDFPGSEEQIALALSHKSHLNYPDNQYGYVRNWLRKDWNAPSKNGAGERIEFSKPSGIVVPDMRFRE